MNVRRVSTLLLTVLLAAIGPVAVSPAPKETATVTANAPIFIGPEVSETPLRVAAPGTVLIVLDRRADWIQVQFNDQQWGRRVGWVHRALVATNPSGQASPLSPFSAKQATALPAVRPCLIAQLKEPLSLDTFYVEGDLPRGMKFRSKISNEWITEVKKHGGLVEAIGPFPEAVDLANARKACKVWQEESQASVVFLQE
jgi:hypothetical protein